MGCGNCAAYAEQEAQLLFQKAAEKQDLANKVTSLAVNAAKTATLKATTSAAEREALHAVELGGWEKALTKYMEDYLKTRLQNALEPLEDELHDAAKDTARVAIYGPEESPGPAPGPVVV